MKDLLQTVKGMHDILGPQLARMHLVESLFVQTAERYGFVRIQTPMLEFADLYHATSEFNESKCYSVRDLKDRNMILRSDPDAPMARIVASHFRQSPRPIKLLFCGSVFRSWNQRRREFRMLSLATFGTNCLSADVEVVRIIADVMECFGFGVAKVRYNNLGLYRAVLLGSIKEQTVVDKVLHAIRFAQDEQGVVTTLRYHGLCNQAIDNILTMMKIVGTDALLFMESLSGIPGIAEECQVVRQFALMLKQYGIHDTEFCLPNLHGTGFYSGLTYRVFPATGSREVGDGGRFDTMVQRLQNEPLSATGIGLGIERFVELVTENSSEFSWPAPVERLLVVYGDPTITSLVRPVLMQLRSGGLVVEEELISRSYKHTVRYARSRGCRRIFTIATGEGGATSVTIDRLDDTPFERVVTKTEGELFTILRK